MSRNPYTPPSTNIAEVPAADASPPKPKAVTLAQIIGILFAIMSVVVIARSTYNISGWQKLGFTATAWYADLGWRITLFALVVVTLFQLPKRSQIGRWCGALLLLVLSGVPIYLAATMDPPDASNPGELVGFILGFLMTFLPLAYWLYAFAFSRKARAYFRSSARN